MIQLAQDMVKVLQDRVKTTLRVVADIAESVGVPSALTSLIPGVEQKDDYRSEPNWTPAPPPPPVEAAPVVEPKPDPAPAQADPAEKNKKRAGTKKRGLESSMDLSDKVRMLKVDEAIKGSTYLARIIWSLGVAEMEGTGPLRPADIARMIMSRSAVSLEPPNVARYIRRSKPASIVVAYTEGNSQFYKLNDAGHALFDKTFGLKK
jgi:hypothetical protein